MTTDTAMAELRMRVATLLGVPQQVVYVVRSRYERAVLVNAEGYAATAMLVDSFVEDHPREAALSAVRMLQPMPEMGTPDA